MENKLTYQFEAEPVSFALQGDGMKMQLRAHWISLKLQSPKSIHDLGDKEKDILQSNEFWMQCLS